jgi:exoribonuclease-2
MYPGAGCVVEFMQGDRPHIAFVLEEAGGKFRLLTLAKRESKMAAQRLLPWSGPFYDTDSSRQEILDILAKHEKAREELAEGVDTEEIWSFSQGELDRADPAWFAGLIWEEPDVDQIAAMGRALLGRKTHFKFQPPDFEIFTEDKVEAKISAQAAAEERERIVNAGRAFFHALWQKASKGDNSPTCPPDEDIADRLEQLLHAAMGGCKSGEDESLWKEMVKGLPDEQHLALSLSRAWGIVEQHYNYLLNQEGYAWGDAWSAEHAEAVEQQIAYAREYEAPAIDAPFVSVDSPTTRDIDDAYVLEEREDGGMHLRLILSCPALGYAYGSDFDRAVRDRASSLYLPEGTSHMLPEKLGLDYFSLVAGREVPAMLLDFQISSQGVVEELQPSMVRVAAAENTHYEEVEGRLRSGNAPMHRTALDLAKALRAKRLERGAVIIVRPDPKLELAYAEENGEKQGVTVDLLDQPTGLDSQLIISELMILTNAAVSAWAEAKGIPLLRRSQDICIPKEGAGIWEQPEDSYQAMKLLSCNVLETRAKPHAGLGVASYAPISSPLRRYVDLLNQGQVLHFLEHGKPRFDEEELQRMTSAVSSRSDAVGRIQRYRPRYWKLLYFKQNPEKYYDAVVVDEGNFVTAALPCEQIYVRAPLSVFGEKAAVGSRYKVRLDKVKPLENEIHIAEALED